MDYLLLVAAIHLFVCPFTKSEEYFNVQAMHDILYHGRNLSQYHHLDLGSDVPQTFIGAIIVSVLVSPFNYLIENCGLPGITKFTAQIIVRAGLGACVIWSYVLLKNAVEDRFGKQVANWFILISSTQFHFMFYCTRPLLNMMVMPCVLLSLRYWLLENHRKMIWFSAASVVIFKPELASLFAIIMAFEVIQRRISYKKALKISIQAGLGCLVLTVLVDSCMWQRPTWPSGEAFLRNIVNGQQSPTIQPFLWYWYSAIPRALCFSALFVPIGAYLERRMLPLLSVCSTFILLNSFLPHKESRFIIYTFPLFNVIASCGCNILWNGRHKSFIRQCLSTAAALHLGGNLIINIMLLSIAYSNYPGGAAIQRLHNIIPSDSNVDVYIDEEALKSGVTRFTEINNNWKYNTSDWTERQNSDVSKFTHLLIEARSKYSKNLRPFFKSHDVIDSVEGFSHLHINYQFFPPFRIKKKPIFSILQRKDPFSMRNKEDIDGPSDLQNEEDEEQPDDNQLDNQRVETIDHPKYAEEMRSSSKQTIADQILITSVKTSNKKDLNANGQEGDTIMNESVSKLSKLLASSFKGQQISQPLEPDSTIIRKRDEEQSNNTERDQGQTVHQTESTEASGDFLGESDETALLLMEKTSKLNSRINKSSMKTIRSKINNLAFDALQDALREEEIRKIPTTENPENQLIMMMPLVSSRRKFVLPNADPSVTFKQGGNPNLEEHLRQEPKEFPKNSKKADKTQDTPTKGLQYQQAGRTQGNIMGDQIYEKDEIEPSLPYRSRLNEMVQYNPNSQQLAVLNQDENGDIHKQSKTAVDTSAPSSSPLQSEVVLSKRQIAEKDPLNVKLEQTLEEVSTGNDLQIYGTKPLLTHTESTSPSMEETKSKPNSVSQKVSTYQKPFIFLWFPEEMKVMREQGPKGLPRSQTEVNENVSSDQLSEKTTTNPEERILVKDTEIYGLGKHMNQLSTGSKKMQVVMPQKKEPRNEKPETTSDASNIVMT